MELNLLFLRELIIAEGSILTSAIVLVVTVAVWNFLSVKKYNRREEMKPESEIENTESKASKEKTKGIRIPKVVRHHHALDLNTVKGHADSVTGIAFSSDGLEFATACMDRIVRVFHIDDIASKSFRFLRINLPTGLCPVKIAFSNKASTVAVSCTNPSNDCSLALYGPSAATGKEAQGKLPPPELKWEQSAAHGKKAILTLVSVSPSQGTTCLLASSSEGTDIKLWTASEGKCVATVDTNQLKNTMAEFSPNGRFLAAAAFTADVKIWEVRYEKTGAFKDISKVMQLNGHKSAVTWLTFTADSNRIVSASKDGSVKLWNINVRYEVNEDTKCVASFPIAAKEGFPQYDIIALSPDDKILAASHSKSIIWHSLETGEVLDVAHNVHEDAVTALVWAPKPMKTEHGLSHILASGSLDKKVKFWREPSLRKGE